MQCSHMVRGTTASNSAKQVVSVLVRAGVLLDGRAELSCAGFLHGLWLTSLLQISRLCKVSWAPPDGVHATNGTSCHRNKPEQEERADIG